MYSELKISLYCREKERAVANGGDHEARHDNWIATIAPFTNRDAVVGSCDFLGPMFSQAFLGVPQPLTV
jgi:hypothetical protein